ncbi:RNA polymerase sigma factor [Streptomyces fenghuangensis]|uniref:RNA polymerase sigma factor n=1 Tax=Streptomyces chitinivorans TaxID=1257027 RepID=A0ABW7HRY3_9ACTN|nr:MULTISPECIES: sigma-70 family RNA polymerase sigma factor [Streptomyces]MCG3044062.1 sigma-70 family RNA polymerase sigma factor [Streptomyces sp. ICN903]MDH2410968.1 sigma-70 family RNA polymerase sigma factor [Streptomyces chitinivorans]
MNTPDNVPVDVDADPPQPLVRNRRTTLTFDAFHEYHHRVWLRYARTQVGSRAGAEAVVEAACAQLLSDWNHVLEQESVPAYAWAVLKERIREWLDRDGRAPALAETAAFEAACRGRLLDELLDEADGPGGPDAAGGFTALENGLRLYAAIAELPERQHDIVVLRYVLGCPEEDVAEYLGCGTVAVRAQVRHAKRKLAAGLGQGRNHRTGER